MAGIIICSIFGLVLSVIAIIANIAVVISIYKQRTFIQPSIFNIGCICLSNCVVSGIRFVLVPFGASAHLFRIILAGSFIFVQLGLHSALAYDRWNAVSKPLKYRQPGYAKTSKRITLFTVLAGMAIGVAICAPQNHVSYNVNAIILGFRSVATVTLTLAYIRIYVKVRERSTRIGDNPSNDTNSSVASQVRTNREKYLFLASLWITMSFLVLNIPLAVFATFVQAGAPCASVDGAIFAFVYFCFVFSSVCDPISFFMMERRRKRASVAQIHPGPAGNVQ